MAVSLISSVRTKRLRFCNPSLTIPVSEGGIFWCYGLFTFARFLGSHSEMGWAWNVSPIGNTISGEFVESAAIFLYGITNTWMERFGVNPGDPYTTKQVQHISIAVRRNAGSLSTLPNIHSQGHVLVCWSRRDGNGISTCTTLVSSFCDDRPRIRTTYQRCRATQLQS